MIAQTGYGVNVLAYGADNTGIADTSTPQQGAFSASGNAIGGTYNPGSQINAMRVQCANGGSAFASGGSIKWYGRN